jgi:hypothetical protein
MLDYEDGSNLRWLVAAAMIALGMAIVAVRYDDNPAGRARVSAGFATSAAASAGR